VLFRSPAGAESLGENQAPTEIQVGCGTRPVATSKMYSQGDVMETGNPLDIGAPLIPLDEFKTSMLEAAVNQTTDILIFDIAMNFAYMMAGPKGIQTACDIMIEAHKKSGKPVAVVMYSRSSDVEDLKDEQYDPSNVKRKGQGPKIQVKKNKW
jgi:hypothetical protein